MDPCELRLGLPGSPPPGAAIVDASDDLMIISPTAFRQAISSTRNGRTRVTDVEPAARNQRRRLDVDPHPYNLNVEGTRSYMLHVEPVAPPMPPPPPPRPTYTCPICLGPLVDHTTTSCGHVFCNGCIRSALSVQAKCPICRRRITHRGLIKLYFPDPL